MAREADLTPEQRSYLEAFDRLLRARTRPAFLQARVEMRERLVGVCAAAQIAVPDRRRGPRDRARPEEAEAFVALLEPG